MPSLAVRKENPYNIKKAEPSQPVEAMVFCPQCKVMETVWINGDNLMSTRKFTQKGSQIYHDCGASQPCRLYHCW
jgi:hypothetical protein